ncbi:MAG: tRNA (N(6)-L-threonylcarbamoyladenosine(37)-C(2))-methylthiotransferase MtaB [Clostridia bacterium]
MQKVSIITLGCKVNEYETRTMMNILENAGYEVTEGFVPADIYVLNTCAVTAMSEKKSRQMHSKALSINPNAKVIVCGCASQHNPKQFTTKGAHSVIGTVGKENILSLIQQSQLEPYAHPLAYTHTPYAKDTVSRQYIKVQDGCNNFCSYCIIPYLRGRSRSRNLDDIIAEISATHCQEIVLTGIDISDYRIDGRPAMLDLVKAVDKCGVRFRIGSLEPRIISEELVKYLSTSQNFAPSFHISLQSGNDHVLKKMNRKYTRQQYIDSVNLIKRYFGRRAVFTTDIITGFIDETEERFQDSVELCKQVKFAHVHAFPYSVRAGTSATKLQGEKVPTEIARARVKVLEGIDKECRQQVLNDNVGVEHKVLVEEYVCGVAYGYTDNYLRVKFVTSDNVVNQIIQVKAVGMEDDCLVCQI